MSPRSQISTPQDEPLSFKYLPPSFKIPCLYFYFFKKKNGGWGQMKLTDLRNTESEMKHSLHGFNSKLDVAKERSVNIPSYWQMNPFKLKHREKRA